MIKYFNTSYVGSLFIFCQFHDRHMYIFINSSFMLMYLVIDNKQVFIINFK
jgi:hypothetical protein